MKIKNLSLGCFTRILFAAFLLFAFSSCTKEVKSETGSPPDKLSFIAKPVIIKLPAGDIIRNTYDPAKDKIKAYRFGGAGDSVVELPIAPNTEVYVELTDSSNSSHDTFKVYIRTQNVSPVPEGSDVLAYMVKVNVEDTGAQVYTNGVIIPGDGVTVFYKILYPYPSILKIVRSSFYNTRKGDKVIIKAMSSPQGSLELPGIDNMAANGDPVLNPETIINNYETGRLLKRFIYPLKL